MTETTPAPTAETPQGGRRRELRFWEAIALSIDRDAALQLADAAIGWAMAVLATENRS